MKNLNITILSGGSGNDSLIKGLKGIYPGANIKVIVNAYDNGKSTGICRAVTGTLGVSDIRKNHSRMYEIVTPNIDMRLKEFYDGRYSFTPGKEPEEIKAKLKLWGLSKFNPFVDSFFSNPNSHHYMYKDFSVANIVYSQMYKELGYEETNRIFCTLLNLEDFVLLNSFDNVFINAVTESGKVIKDEGDIVEHCDPKDKISKIFYTGDCKENLNPLATQAVLDADLLVISTGTFWSSIYPTLEYGNFYETINRSKAKKIWAINCSEDKDAYAVSSEDFAKIVQTLGLDLSEFTVLLNKDATEGLKIPPSTLCNVVIASMENNRGKHNGDKYARAIFRIFYGIDSADSYDKILFDFDDTLWARNDDNIDVSVENIKLLNDLLQDKATIISGNTYEWIANKLYRVYGTELDKFNLDIWADANSVRYVKGQPKDVIEEFFIDNYLDIISYLENEFEITGTINDEKYPVCIKIRPLGNRERRILASCLNNVFNSDGPKDCVACCTGASTIDILHRDNNKSVVLDTRYNDLDRVLYIGDEIDTGNDKEIASKCVHSIHTTGVNETNMLIRLLVGE